ncbi:hypothetical protein PBS_53460 [Paraburkholderia sp. 2C]
MMSSARAALANDSAQTSAIASAAAGAHAHARARGTTDDNARRAEWLIAAQSPNRTFSTVAFWISTFAPEFWITVGRPLALAKEP